MTTTFPILCSFVIAWTDFLLLSALHPCTLLITLFTSHTALNFILLHLFKKWFQCELIVIISEIVWTMSFNGIQDIFGLLNTWKGYSCSRSSTGLLHMSSPFEALEITSTHPVFLKSIALAPFLHPGRTLWFSQTSGLGMSLRISQYPNRDSVSFCWPQETYEFLFLLQIIHWHYLMWFIVQKLGVVHFGCERTEGSWHTSVLVSLEWWPVLISSSISTDDANSLQNWNW